MVVLRPQLPEDLPLLPGGDSPFDDFGPAAQRSAAEPSRLDGDGALTVVAADGEVAGEVSWHWQRWRWGPNDGSSCPMFGIWLRPQYRGRGLGTAAPAALIDLLFPHTTTHRVEAHTDIQNVAEQRARWSEPECSVKVLTAARSGVAARITTASAMPCCAPTRARDDRCNPARLSPTSKSTEDAW